MVLYVSVGDAKLYLSVDLTPPLFLNELLPVYDYDLPLGILRLLVTRELFRLFYVFRYYVYLLVNSSISTSFYELFIYISRAWE